MKIVYNSHLKIRLSERKIPQNYPLKVIKEPDQKYYDLFSYHYISIKRLKYSGRKRNMAAVYDIIDGVIEVITIHPIATSEIKNKVKSARWKLYENEKN